MGHEPGHFMIPRHCHEMRCSVNDIKTFEEKQLSQQQSIEMEANRFSAEILMPSKHFQAFDGFDGEPSMQCLIDHADAFDVSFEACVQRYCNQHHATVAIVFSHNGIVRYNCKSPEFPFWIIPGKGDSVPPNSFTKNTYMKPEDSVYSATGSMDRNTTKCQTYINEEVYILKMATPLLCFHSMMKSKKRNSLLMDTRPSAVISVAAQWVAPPAMCPRVLAGVRPKRLTSKGEIGSGAGF